MYRYKVYLKIDLICHDNYMNYIYNLILLRRVAMDGIQKNYDEINSVYIAIKELYLNYCEELEDNKKQLEILCNQIKETKDYIQYLENHQNSDTYVFSPRGVISKNNVGVQEGIYDTGKTINFLDGKKKKDELLFLEEEKIALEKHIEKLESNIILLERNKNILKERSFVNAPLDRLSYILHMTEMIYTFIDNDPVRAKLELKNLKNELQSITRELEKTVNVPEGENK